LLVVGKIIACFIFGVAAASAVAVSAGVGVPPHEEATGTPPGHAHVLGAYRFGFLMPSVTEEQPQVSPAMANLHRVLLDAGVPMYVIAQMPAMGATRSVVPTTLPVIKSASLSPIQDLAIAFALLAMLAPRLARPTRRVIADLPLPRLPAELWRFAPVLLPPRLVVLP
jgi:hypothetical protein